MLTYRKFSNGRTAAALIIMLVFAACVISFAQTAPATHVVIRAGRVLDVKTGQTLTNQAIVIENDKIVSIGPASAAKPAPGAKVIELPNATILPGLIDAHTHLTGNPKD